MWVGVAIMNERLFMPVSSACRQIALSGKAAELCLALTAEITA